MNQDKYIGQLLDNRYEILEVLGVGGMAVVYKARCHRLNRMVAIKILKDEYSQDAEFRRRFHAESQAVAMLSHPNIVSVYDVSSSDDSDYIVMELIDGITLKYYMEKKGVLNWKETLHFAMQIAKALEHAHSRGIVHRDIKPHNVMVLKNGSVKVADFGIAQVMSTSNTMTQEALGSVHYISPEQAKGSRVDSRSDVYSLGIVMYEMISGRVPYDGDTPLSVVMQHINGGAQLPTALNPNTPRALEQIIMKAISHFPKDRYATATAMLYDMDEFRKNPTMVFPEGEVAEETVAPVVSAGTGSIPIVKPPVKPEPPRQTIAQGKVQPKKKQESSNKTATIAIAACSVVGLVAIIILLLLLPSCQGNQSSQNGSNMISVPNFVGMDYNKMGHYDDITVEIQGRDYSSEYPEGCIISQYPEAGEQVAKGTKIFVRISLGSNEIVLKDLTGMEVVAAKAYIEELGLKFVRQVEKSNAVDNNCVIRTEPKAGESVRRGQTVTVYCRLDPEAVVPKVTGLMYEDAVQRLQNVGFWEMAEEVVLEKSNLPYGTVLKMTTDGNNALVIEGRKIQTDTKIYIHISKGKPALEDLSGKTQAEVEAYQSELLEEVNISLEFRYESSVDVEHGCVVRTEPVAGTVLSENQNVIVYLSAGPGEVELPDVRGESIESVREALSALGFTNIVEKEKPSVLEEGMVTSMMPAPGTLVDASTQIQIYISKGDKGLNDLSGMTVEAATDALNALNVELTVNAIGVESETIPAGTVIRTDPEAGSKLRFRQEILVYYSTGPNAAEVPDVEGDDLQTAREKLMEAGFTKLTVMEEYHSWPIGKVLGLSVGDGELVSRDTLIVIYVSKGPAPGTITHDFIIPAHDMPVTVAILCEGVTLGADWTLQPGENKVTLTLTGSGVVEYEVWINGAYSHIETVDFG